jgi:copper homeostasis protein
MKIELCAASFESIQLAQELPIDRIELCQNLEQGGLTPSIGMIDYAIGKQIETHVLIRPRAGGFCYSEEELKIMLLDISYCKRIGVNGIVIGLLTETNEINRLQLEQISEAAQDIDITFHRAFDDTIEWKRSMDLLINMGVKRILTSGVSTNVDSGFIVLREMVKYAKGRIEIMAGGGINANNVGKIETEIKPDAIHFSGTSKILLDEESLFSETILKVDRKKVSRIISSLSIN